MQVADPAALAIGLGLLAGPLGAALARRGHRLLAALLGGAAGAALAGLRAASFSSEPPLLLHAGLAAAAGAATALALPGLGLTSLRRRSFGSGYERSAFGGVRVSARLPARCAGCVPSALLDAADRLRLESALCDAERKSGAELAVAVVARAAEHEGARGRAGAWLAAVALSGALALSAPPLTALAVTAGGALAGRALARTPRLRRFFVAEAALAESAARAALDAFAHAGLARAPRHAGVLLFAALFEGRAIAVIDRGIAPSSAEPMARAAAEGFAEGQPLDGLLASLDALGPAEGAPASGVEADSSPLRPHPVRVED
jgi:uncharacterized membrane protein